MGGTRLLSILRPQQYLDSVAAIDLKHLRRRGIRALILDLDNTLVAWGRERPARAVARWLKEARRQGFRQVIVSNNTGTRVERVAQELGVPCIPKAKKPLGASYRRALALLSARPDETAVIGDQVFTDVLGGNRLGLYTILVRPLARRELFPTRVVRLAERVVLRRLLKLPEGRFVNG
jgi:HAD superfamily phosphatase (TIGR01668 family)